MRCGRRRGDLADVGIGRRDDVVHLTAVGDELLDGRLHGVALQCRDVLRVPYRQHRLGRLGGFNERRLAGLEVEFDEFLEALKPPFESV